jgi:hypothetical protein
VPVFSNPTASVRRAVELTLLCSKPGQQIAEPIVTNAHVIGCGPTLYAASMAPTPTAPVLGLVDVGLVRVLRFAGRRDGELLFQLGKFLRRHVANMGNAVEVVEAGERAVPAAVADDFLGAARAESLDSPEMNSAGGVQVELFCHGSTFAAAPVDAAVGR